MKPSPDVSAETPGRMAEAKGTRPGAGWSVPQTDEESDPYWYKDAVIYELHVRAFHDSDRDGIGDFGGLVEKLDYLQELGVTAIWLLPFYPSPLRDDGYDIADYRQVHASYGTLDDFRLFLREAHKRDIRVITELVINHTSDQHPWFQRARKAPKGSAERDFYVWSDDPDLYSEARVIFQDFEPSNWTWDPVAEQYFWHRFYHHQPDLNFENREVWEELFAVVDFWMEMGVDGMRLDAIPYLYERDGTNCENLPETHEFLKRLRAHIDEKFEDRMLLGEANQWPEDAARYFGDGDECHMSFHFPIMPRLFMSLRMENRFPIIDILEQTPEIPDSAQWAMFLRNHDELTLEMVTDEERDYMYRVYARDEQARVNLGIRRRLVPLLGSHRHKVELMNSLLFALPGTPVLYYGDEIGMGDNIYLGDRNGMRTPMQWSGDRNAGFSRANQQQLYLPVVVDPEFHYESVNVEAQQSNRDSLLWWMRRLIQLRKRYQAFGRGDLIWLTPENERVLAFVRRWEDQTILIVANLSRFVQHVSLDLSELEGMTPVELFGRTSFPTIGEGTYFLTLGPHGFYWFGLEKQHVETERPGNEPTPGEALGPEHVPAFHVAESWTEIFERPHDGRTTRALLDYLRARRWYGGKGREVREATIEQHMPVRTGPNGWHSLFLRIEYFEGETVSYFMPLVFLEGEEARAFLDEHEALAIARVIRPEGDGFVADAGASEVFARDLLQAMTRGTALATSSDGTALRGSTRLGEADPLPGDEREVEIEAGAREQSNTSIVYDKRWIAKIFRRLEPGMNLERELGGYLTDIGFANTPPLIGALDFSARREDPVTLAVLHEYVPESRDAWTFTLEALGRYFERALAAETSPDELALPDPDLVDDSAADVPGSVYELIGPYLEFASLLGTRTGELHLALASERYDPAFAPKPFTSLYQRSLYQSMRNLVSKTFRRLERAQWPLPEDDLAGLERLTSERRRILEELSGVLRRRLDAARIRVHGDYHLGQVLHTGKDFMIIDFEGEPDRPIGERRLKRSSLRDTAGMLRSFDYATSAAAHEMERRQTVVDPAATLEPWGRFWYGWVSTVFLKAYYQSVEHSTLLPTERSEREMLLRVFLLEKALYELGYEIDNRPEWIGIPTQGILRLLDSEGPSSRAFVPEERVTSSSQTGDDPS